MFLTRCISAVDCGEPQPLQNGSITGGSTVYPNVMHLSCDEGFILQGSSKIQCQTNGNWSKTLSFCKRKQSAFFARATLSCNLSRFRCYTASCCLMLHILPPPSVTNFHLEESRSNACFLQQEKICCARRW